MAKVVADCCKATASEYTVNGSSSTGSSFDASATLAADQDTEANAKAENEIGRLEIFTLRTKSTLLI
jgi:hypothetical protein